MEIDRIAFIPNFVYSSEKIEIKDDGAEPSAHRGYSAYASESDIHKSSIFNIQ